MESNTHLKEEWSVGILQSIDQSPAASVHEFGSIGFSQEELEDQWAENFLSTGTS